MGVLLSAYQDETFEGASETHQFVFKLTKRSRRWDGDHPHVRYTFEVVSKQPLEEFPHPEAEKSARPGGEEAAHEEAESSAPTLPEQDGLEQYQPEEIPTLEEMARAAHQSVPAEEGSSPGVDLPWHEGSLAPTTISAHDKEAEAEVNKKPAGLKEGHTA